MRAKLPARFCQSARKQARYDADVQEEAHRLFRSYNSYAIDIVICAVVMVAIRDWRWGTGKRATKIPRMIASIRETIDYYCDRYGHDCAMTAMRRDLREYGVEYEGGDSDV